MLYIALLHWPCIDKNGKEIATAITNLDLHDLARVCLTYGVNTLYIVHPYQVQLDFAKTIMNHWLKGFGGVYNPVRKKAFEIIELVKDIKEIKQRTGACMIGTSASMTKDSLSWGDVKNLSANRDVCLVFGTGWGMSPSIISEFDAMVQPIEGAGEYNHLSVRSAVSISIDRIIGR